MRIKKKFLQETEFIVDKDAMDDFDANMQHKIDDDDVVKVVSTDESVNDEEVIEESVKPVIKKKDLLKILKSHK